MRFKTLTQQDQFDGRYIWPLLKEILRDAEDFSKDNGGNDFVITSVIRSDKEDLALHGSGIHCTGRAADVRADGWDDPHMATVVRYVNNKYVYDISRPTLLVALFTEHGNGAHVHFQVHARTQIRKG